MVGKRSGKALLREEGKSSLRSTNPFMRADRYVGLERTDNNMDLSTWPQINMINQKNYYTYLLLSDATG